MDHSMEHSIERKAVDAYGTFDEIFDGTFNGTFDREEGIKRLWNI